MKDVVIKGKSIRTELFVLTGAFTAACFLNVYAIVYYSRPWTELFTSLGYIVVTSFAIYFILWVPRLVFLLLKKIYGNFIRKK